MSEGSWHLLFGVCRIIEASGFQTMLSHSNLKFLSRAQLLRGKTLLYIQ